MKTICKFLFTVVLSGITLGVSAEKINVATYNIRLETAGDNAKGNGWSVRAPHVADLVRYHDFEIFGTQEGLPRQIKDLEELLPEYDHIGVGRDDGKNDGEHAAIFFRKDLFEPIESGNFWFSETPEKPSKGWDAACKRICTWGLFKDKRTGFEFMMMNLHLDHKGTKARRESARMLLERVATLPDSVPVIITGDFNVDQRNEIYSMLRDSSKLDDSFDKAEIVYAPNGTYNGFNPDSFTESRIDHIFVSPSLKVDRYGILTDSYRTGKRSEGKKHDQAPDEIRLEKLQPRTPSDHFPVAVTLEY